MKLRGAVVYDKTLSRVGKVVREDSFSIYVEFPPLVGDEFEYVVVTPGRFKTRFILADVEHEQVEEEVKKEEAEKERGENGDGKILWGYVRKSVFKLVNEPIVITKETKNRLRIYYKNTLALKVYVRPNKLVLHCKKEALSPEVNRYVSKILKQGGHRARFDLYVEEGISSLINSIVIDTMYYAKIMEDEKNGKNYE